MSNYLVHNGSRSRSTRFIRAAMPEHGGHKQYICGSQYRLVLGRPVVLSEEMLRKHLEELRLKSSQGLVFVTTEDGKPFDLQSFQAGPVVPESPRPNPRLDSAANDKNSGVAVSSVRNEAPPPAEFEMPVEAPAAALEDNPLVVESSVEAPVAEVPEVKQSKKRGSR